VTLRNCALNLFVVHKFTIIIKHFLLLSSLKQNYNNICTCPQHRKTSLQSLYPQLLPTGYEAGELEQLTHDSGKQQKKLDKYLILCMQFWAPDDGRRNSL